MSSLEARLKRLAERMPPPKCRHPIGLWAPSDEELIRVRQELAACAGCKGKAALKVTTEEAAGEFKRLFTTMLSEFTPEAQKGWLAGLEKIAGEASA